jgi:hypothetical protein
VGLLGLVGSATSCTSARHHVVGRPSSPTTAVAATAGTHTALHVSCFKRNLVVGVAESPDAS